MARAQELGRRLVELADEDAAAYREFMAARTPETRRRIVAVPEEIAAHADEIAALADRLRLQLRTGTAGDAAAGAELARAAARVARQLAALNT